MQCCSGFCAATQRQFDARVAGRDLARYRRKGPHATARDLRRIIISQTPMRGTLLDIGAGVGALTFELLNAGFGHATAVDASSAYVAAGREETIRRDLTHDVKWIEGDFVGLPTALAPADLVTLDRVVCCYPAYEPLLEAALDHARQMVGLSYPHDRWYVRAVIAVENTIRWLRGDAFRTFVHAPIGMAELFRTRGFRLIGRHTTLAWTIDLYAREGLGTARQPAEKATSACGEGGDGASRDPASRLDEQARAPSSAPGVRAVDGPGTSRPRHHRDNFPRRH